jgi:predicted transcriptional regulator of viral defense system
VTLIEARNKIHQLHLPILHTHEVAKILGLSNSQASLCLHRLKTAGEVLSLKKGLWLLDKSANVFFIGEQLARPYPGYVSLQTALYLHGLISQMPETVYVVTLGRSQSKNLNKTSYSFHHTEGPLFDGFEMKENFNLASPERALFDFFYFSATRKKAFKALPELEIPRRFKIKKIRAWCALIKNPRLRSHVESQVKLL